MSCRGGKIFIFLNLNIVETCQGILLILRIIEHNCVIVGRALHPSFYLLTKLTILTKLWSLLVQKLEIKFAFVPSLRKRCSIEGGRGKLLSKENANLKSSQNMTRELYEKQALIMALFLAQIDRLLHLLSIAHSWTLEIHLTLLGPGRGGHICCHLPQKGSCFFSEHARVLV